MMRYHVTVVEDDGWFGGRVLEREGVTTQGRTLDELVFMVRDAISLMWGQSHVQLELILPGTSHDTRSKRKVPSKIVGRTTAKTQKSTTLKAG